MSVYVGIDVHRKRSQVAVVTEDGKVQVNRNVPNGVEPILKVIGGLPTGTPVAFEAAYGWGWLVELLENYGFDPHMVHPLRCKAIASARLKNDKVDAAILGQLLRADLLPEAWIAPADVRQLRALLRHRVALVRMGTRLRNRIHSVAADHGYHRPDRQWTGAYWTGPGRQWLAELPLPAVSRQIVNDSLAFIDTLAPTIAVLDREVHTRAKADPRVKVLTALPGVGEFTAMVLLAEIGNISRFRNARALASWAGLTPTVRGSDLTVRYGHISKQGSPYVRWVLNQAAHVAKRASRIRRHLPVHYQAAREEDRHSCGDAQAVDPRLPPTRRRRRHTPRRREQHDDREHQRARLARRGLVHRPGGSPSPGRARPQRHEPATSRARSFD
jgi:transposase